jgi:hypothetical protein
MQLPPERPQVPSLNLDQLLPANKIDKISIDFRFDLIARARIPLFQRCV